ncbi:MAG: response regulator [Geminicoccaceae bacterium]
MVVLIVEDDALIGAALAAVLLGAGHQSLGPALDAQDALRLADAYAPELAFVDITLAGHVDGVSVARTLTKRHGITCVFVTAELERARASSGFALGVVRKPYDPRMLPAVVSVVAAIRTGRLLPPAPRHFELFD